MNTLYPLERLMKRMAVFGSILFILAGQPSKADEVYGLKVWEVGGGEINQESLLARLTSTGLGPGTYKVSFPESKKGWFFVAVCTEAAQKARINYQKVDQGRAGQSSVFLKSDSIQEAS